MVSLRLANNNLTKASANNKSYLVALLLMGYDSLCVADKVEEMTHAQKASPVDMKIATIKPRPSSRCLVTASDVNVRKHREASLDFKPSFVLPPTSHINF